MTPRLLSHARLLAVVTLPLYLLDQATKIAVVARLPYGGEQSVIPGFFDLVHWHNYGAAFSLLDSSVHANVFFVALSAVALAILTVLGARNVFQSWPARLAWALLLAGILGNLTDRLWHGYVVDFLLFDLHIPFAHPWPAFNVADSCICVATGLFVLDSFRATPSPAASA